MKVLHCSSGSPRSRCLVRETGRVPMVSSKPPERGSVCGCFIALQVELQVAVEVSYSSVQTKESLIASGCWDVLQAKGAKRVPKPVLSSVLECSHPCQ